MSSKQQIDKDREKIIELYKIIREKTHNYELAIEALVLANKYLNKADNQRMELALLKPYEEIVRCKDCEFYKKDGCLGLCDIHKLTIVGTDDFCSFAERKEK